MIIRTFHGDIERMNLKLYFGTAIDHTVFSVYDASCHGKFPSTPNDRPLFPTRSHYLKCGPFQAVSAGQNVLVHHICSLEILDIVYYFADYYIICLTMTQYNIFY